MTATSHGAQAGVKVGPECADISRMARKSKSNGDGVIDVEVVDDTEPMPSGKRPARLGIGTVVKPCLLGALILTAVGAVLPH